MTSESLPDHILRPHLRPIQPLPIRREERNFVALRDPSMLQKQTMVVPVQAMPVLQQFQGRLTLDELASQFKSNRDQLEELSRGLDTVGLLWGPTFDRLESERWQELESAGAFPARATTTLGADEAECRATIDGYFAETEDPEIEDPAIAIVAPHLDYPRGWPNYAAAYYPLLETDAPDRVVILGTNHFGLGDGVVVTELGFDSPMGRCPTDEAVINTLVEELGRPVVVDQLDHLPEHSIELHVPWIQYCFGSVPVVAALIPNPLDEMIDDEEGRVKNDRFTDALRSALDDAGGRTLFVASADLSHVGPQFGEPRPVDDQRRLDVERHDRDMMSKYLAGDPEEFVAAMRWNKNPTRWCSIGNMTTLLELTNPQTVELIDYRQACDEKGLAMVSSAAMVLC